MHLNNRHYALHCIYQRWDDNTSSQDKSRACLQLLLYDANSNRMHILSLKHKQLLRGATVKDLNMATKSAMPTSWYCVPQQLSVLSCLVFDMTNGLMTTTITQPLRWASKNYIQTATAFFAATLLSQSHIWKPLLQIDYSSHICILLCTVYSIHNYTPLCAQKKILKAYFDYLHL